MGVYNNVVYRLFVERKEGFRFEAQNILSDLRNNLSVEGLTDVRLIFRYDVEGVSAELLEKAKKTIFSEPQSDLILSDIGAKEGDTVFASEYLPGQFDQRADSCSQCIQLLSQGDRPAVRTARSMSSPARSRTRSCATSRST